MTTKYLYDNYINTLSSRLNALLSTIEAEYGFEYSIEFEQVICQFLRLALPMRFGVTRGYVVNSNGEKAGDDIIIYDQNRFPSLLLRERDDFSRKENIPIEAVYCYIEAKHTINIDGSDGQSLFYATKQIDKVKKLCGSRPKVPLMKEGIVSNSSIELSSELPYQNPVFGMIISRYVRHKMGKDILYDPRETAELLFAYFKSPLSDGISEFPDCMSLGGQIIVSPIVMRNETEAELTLFYPPKVRGKYGYFTAIVEGNAVGIAFAALMAALEWIRLSKMPWSEIMTDAIRIPTK